MRDTQEAKMGLYREQLRAEARTKAEAARVMLAALRALRNFPVGTYGHEMAAAMADAAIVQADAAGIRT
jgi:hypothetical protein